jgi:cytochrome P450
VTSTAVAPNVGSVSIHQLEQDPHPVLRRLRTAGAVGWLDALDGWVVTGRVVAERVLRDPGAFTVDHPRFSTAQVVGPSMLSLDGSAHARHRDPFARELRTACADIAFRARVEQKARELVDTIAPTGRAELRSTVAGPLAVFAMAEILGLGDTDAATVRGWYDGIVAAVSDITARRSPDPRGAEAFGALRDHVQAAIDTGSRHTVVAAAAGRLSVDEVVSNTAVLLFGGVDTAEGMIANLVRHLLLHPAQLAEVAGERDVLSSAFEESVRLEPPAASVDRYATDDTVLEDARIRRGDLVTVSLAGANRDPAVFSDPDAFDLHRPNAARHLSFAHGPHFCIGAQLARLEARAALDAVLDRLSGLRLDDDHDATPRGLVFRRPPRLHVRWDPQEAASARACR